MEPAERRPLARELKSLLLMYAVFVGLSALLAVNCVGDRTGSTPADAVEEGSR